MAVLSDADRQRIWRGLMRWWSQVWEEITSISSVDLKAAVDATDNWIDSNAASYNSALPAAARTNLTSGQKSALFVMVALMRYNVNLLKRLVGEVD